MSEPARPYRVYPQDERARSFSSLERAIRFARAAYGRQVITDMSPVAVGRYTGTSDGGAVGRYGLNGWEWACASCKQTETCSCR